MSVNVDIEQAGGRYPRNQEKSTRHVPFEPSGMQKSTDPSFPFALKLRLNLQVSTGNSLEHEVVVERATLRHGNSTMRLQSGQKEVRQRAAEERAACDRNQKFDSSG